MTSFFNWFTASSISVSAASVVAACSMISCARRLHRRRRILRCRWQAVMIGP
jgi:hypothetical protein